jgi:hypothetical protein
MIGDYALKDISNGKPVKVRSATAAYTNDGSRVLSVILEPIVASGKGIGYGFEFTCASREQFERFEVGRDYSLGFHFNPEIERSETFLFPIDIVIQEADTCPKHEETNA